MRGGGTERVLSILLKNLSRADKEVFLIVLEDKFDYEIPDYVKVIKLSSDLNSNFKKLFGIFLGAIKLRKIIKNRQINVVISFLERSNYINILAKSLGACHKAYISERCNTLEYYSDKGLKSFFSLFLVKILYKKANLIIANSFGIKKMLVKDFSLEEKKIKVIYNPIDFKKIQTLSQELLESEYQKLFKYPIIINVGRLIREKGQEYLIRAFGRAAKQIPDIKLLILGQGELEKDLKSLVKKLNLENDVFFLGWQKNPFKFLNKAKLFVLSSLTEGFPNALIEAMACNIPVISFDCLSGPNEIVINGKNGILVPLADEKVLTQAIIQVLKNPFLAERLVWQGQKRAQDFSLKNIISQYEEII